MTQPTNPAGKTALIVSSGGGRPLVARTWRGRTKHKVADEYLAYLYSEGVLPIEAKPGCLGMQLFRRFDDEFVEFTTISYWESFESMAKGMHGDREMDDHRRVAHLERDAEFLIELPEFAEISEVHANDWLFDTSG